MIKASCAWGDGPDVIVVLTEHAFVLYESPTMGNWVHGAVKNGSFDLTADEALNLAQRLIAAASEAKELDRVANSHDVIGSPINFEIEKLG